MTAKPTLEGVLRLCPAGALRPEAGTVVRVDLETVAQALDLAVAQRDALMVEVDPRKAEALLGRWEELLDLSTIDADVDARRRRVLAAVRVLPNFRPVTIEARVEEITGVGWTLVEPGPFKTNDPNSLTDTLNDVLDGAHVFILYGDRDDAVAFALRRDLVRVFLERVKPAHTVGLMSLEGFVADDDYSLTDLDTLGI